MNNIHFIGIGGIGMSGLASILLEQGSFSVSGSDLKSNILTEQLQKKGAKISLGHSAKNLPASSTVIVSTDISEDNPELKEARKQKYPIQHRSDLLRTLMQDHAVIAITGTHGKTSTSSLLSHLMETARLDPSYAIGGILLNTLSNARHGKGSFFVAEADESDGTFLKYSYTSAIITNIDTDHIEHYGSLDRLEEAFSLFAQKAPDPRQLFYCGDDSRLARLCTKGISYGFSQDNALCIIDARYTEEGCYFSLFFEGKTFENLYIPLFGTHNILNATAVFGLAYTLNIPEDLIRSAFSSFKGVQRRLEKKKSGPQCTVYDDYAHHPTAIKQTLKAVRQAVGERRIIAIYQPHRSSRMKHCVEELQGAFAEADNLFLLPLYSAQENASQKLEQRIYNTLVTSHPDIPCLHLEKKSCIEVLFQYARPHDVFIFLGAGDSTKYSNEFAEYITNSPPKKWKIGVISGGRNSENKISMASAKNIVTNLNRMLYEPTTFHIDFDGTWNQTAACPTPISLDDLKKYDLFIPVLHGPYGEDGIIQGLLEILHKPYVGCSYRACAVCMDKVMTKHILSSIGIPIVPFQALYKADCTEIPKNLTFPLYIKPAHLGSSVGIEYIIKEEDVLPAIKRVFEYDDTILLEPEIKGRELEVAVLGNRTILTPPPGEILSDGSFFHYAAKYGSNNIKMTPESNIPKELQEKVCQLSKRAYRTLGCSGLTRMDWFLDKEGNWLFNEAQPFPGFTDNSMYPAIWQNHGISQEELLQKLIILALSLHREKERRIHKECYLGKSLEGLCTL